MTVKEFRRLTGLRDRKVIKSLPHNEIADRIIKKIYMSKYNDPYIYVDELQLLIECCKLDGVLKKFFEEEVALMAAWENRHQTNAKASR